MSDDAVASPRALRRFRNAYGRHRRREGRGPARAPELLALPFLDSGPWASEWAVRARTYRAFVDRVLEPVAARRGSPLRVVDLGAGNGWLCYRMEERGHRGVAVDLRTDRVDGLGAADPYAHHLDRMFHRVAATFQALPLTDRCADVAVFNASLHYATDLRLCLLEATRVLRPGGRVAILDSPFYRSRHDGEAMAEEKRRRAPEVFGDLSDELTALPSVEYLTRDRLDRASEASGLTWRRERVLYPLRYEMRPLRRLLGKRAPSRFDLWWAEAA